MAEGINKAKARQRIRRRKRGEGGKIITAKNTKRRQAKHRKALEKKLRKFGGDRLGKPASIAELESAVRSFNPRRGGAAVAV